jgi:hypothetical protein
MDTKIMVLNSDRLGSLWMFRAHCTCYCPMVHITMVFIFWKGVHFAEFWQPLTNSRVCALRIQLLGVRHCGKLTIWELQLLLALIKAKVHIQFQSENLKGIAH